jgi:hypothetical protein
MRNNEIKPIEERLKKIEQELTTVKLYPIQRTLIQGQTLPKTNPLDSIKTSSKK